MTETVQGSNVYEVLPEVLTSLNYNKEQLREISELLYQKHGISNATLAELVVNPDKITTVDEEQLTAIVLGIYEVTKNEKIEPEMFYNQKEIGKAMKYKFKDDSKISLPYTFEGVIGAPTGRDFVTILSYREIANLWNNEILTYNFAVQRLSKKKVNAKGEIKESADINKKSVQTITKLMKENRYKADTLLFNILVDGNDNIEYSDGELTIGEGTTVNLIDGAHRVQAIISVLEEEPDFEGYINVAIKHYPLSESQRLIGQINTVNRFDKTLIKKFKADTLGDQIANDLELIPELRNRIAPKTALDKKIVYYTNYAVLSESIDTIFEPKTTKDRYDYLDVLKKFFGYLISNYQDKFKNRNTLLKTDWFVHHNMFVLFIVLAKKLYDKYGKDFPVSEIVRVIDSINFSKEESELNTILTSQGKVNSNQVKRQIRKFAEEKIDELLK